MRYDQGAIGGSIYVKWIGAEVEGKSWRNVEMSPGSYGLTVSFVDLREAPTPPDVLKAFREAHKKAKVPFDEQEYETSGFYCACETFGGGAWGWVPRIYAEVAFATIMIDTKQVKADWQGKQIGGIEGVYGHEQRHVLAGSIAYAENFLQLGKEALKSHSDEAQCYAATILAIRKFNRRHNAGVLAGKTHTPPAPKSMGLYDPIGAMPAAQAPATGPAPATAPSTAP
jgi:hypothetical protein